MTLFELLHKVSFDDLIPTLKEVYDVETDIYAYREAFDELNLLRPTGRGDGDYRPATLYESIFKYGLLLQRCLGEPSRFGYSSRRRHPIG